MTVVVPTDRPTSVRYRVIKRFVTSLCYLSSRDVCHTTVSDLFPFPFTREKERDLTQSYDESLFTNRKFKNKLTTQNIHQKLRLHNHCGPTIGNSVIDC